MLHRIEFVRALSDLKGAGRRISANLAKSMGARTGQSFAFLHGVPRILIVDDEENLRKSLALGLKVEGFDSVQAASGIEAIEMLNRGLVVDVVLVDLMMPGLNGLEVARHITRVHPEIITVLCSAYHLSHRQLDRSNCGAIGFIPKPYVIAELVSYLREKIESPTSSRRAQLIKETA